MNELNQFIDIRHTMYIIRLWRISESLSFIWSIPPYICVCVCVCMCLCVYIKHKCI